MDAALTLIAQEAQRIATALPGEVVRTIAEAIAQLSSDDGSYARVRIVNRLPTGEFRARVQHLFQVWDQQAPAASPQSVALALLTASTAEEIHRHDQAVDLVWTGPDSRVIPLRRIDQALQQLIDEARQHLTIVSFAVYKAESILQAIAAAAERGVAITLCLETPDASEGKIAFDTIRALGADVAQHAQRVVWSHDQRPHSPDGKHGSLHAKVAVADGKALLISSANLTEYAMTLNMEMGVLIRGGELPRKVEAHFAKLIEQGILRRL